MTQNIKLNCEDFKRTKLIQYIPEFDSIRALAALAVLFSHFLPFKGSLSWIFVLDRLGDLGVDLFFVLSGFLITGILLDCRDLSETLPLHKSLRQFYIRRILRIFPLYYFVVCMVMFFACFVVFGMSDSLKNWFWLMSYTVNFGKIYTPSGWEPFYHFWTLAVEEQFYLIWPLIVLYVPKKSLPFICIFISLFSLAARVVLIYNGSTRLLATHLTFCCMEPLTLAGLFCIYRREQKSTKIIAVFSIIIGLFASMAIWIYGTESLVIMFSRAFYALMFAGALSFIPDLSGSSSLALLRFYPLRYLGKISYGLYVWHVPVLWWVGFGGIFAFPLSKTELMLNFLEVIVLTVSLSILSWHGFEKPINSYKQYFEYDLGLCPTNKK